MTWREIKEYIDKYVNDDEVINYIDIEPDTCLYFAVISEAKGKTIVNGNGTIYAKPYEWSCVLTRLYANGTSIEELSAKINKSTDEILFAWKIASINREKGLSEDQKITSRDAKKLWEMDFDARRKILTERYL